MGAMVMTFAPENIAPMGRSCESGCGPSAG